LLTANRVREARSRSRAATTRLSRLVGCSAAEPEERSRPWEGGRDLRRVRLDERSRDGEAEARRRAVDLALRKLSVRARIVLEQSAKDECTSGRDEANGKWVVIATSERVSPPRRILTRPAPQRASRIMKRELIHRQERPQPGTPHAGARVVQLDGVGRTADVEAPHACGARSAADITVHCGWTSTSTAVDITSRCSLRCERLEIVEVFGRA
jgi:hypothetical protein